MIAALLLGVQAAAAPPRQSFSILAPPCPASSEKEVVVCARDGTPRLPLPDERGPPDGPRRPTGDPRAGLDAASHGACALRGCQVGVDVSVIGVAAIRLLGKLIDPDSCCERPGQGTSLPQLIGDAAGGARRARAGTPDARERARRVPIALDEPPRQGRLLP